MELERERGITIQSAATYCQWNEHHINIIDTPGKLSKKDTRKSFYKDDEPKIHKRMKYEYHDFSIFNGDFHFHFHRDFSIGHVDFTIEVERALRVLDGAILVLCAVGGVQSQTLTVDRQMKRYAIPRLCFINKMDRVGADPWKTIELLREKLKLNVASIHVPIMKEHQFEGIVDLIRQKAYYFEGSNGENRKETMIPPELHEEVFEKRKELMESLAEVDDDLAEKFLSEEEPTEAQLHAAIRRATISLQFAPVLIGSAFKNKGIQNLLDAVGLYLPDPGEVNNFALDQNQAEEKINLIPDERLPFVGLGFKLEEGRFGQLTYLRVYQGSLKRGSFIFNTRDSKKIKVPRLVRMHANEMEDVEEVKAGDICAMFGIECSSGDTFTDQLGLRYTMTSMFVPQPVMSLALHPKSKETMTSSFSKALNRFQKEDPTFRVHFDVDSGQTIISGMGELHLDIYVERLRREYNCDCTVGKPQVAFREMVGRKIEFNYTHKKQSGGAGQFARVIGYLEPLPESHKLEIEFVSEVVGMAIPENFINACEKGFREACLKGALLGQPVAGVRMVLQDGMTHIVDSSELAFKLATIYAFRKVFEESMPVLLEPIMDLEVVIPIEFQVNE